MLKSMTGYGKSTASLANKKYTIEIRSLNSKGQDVYLKLPTAFKSKEIPLRKMIGSALDRGKIECLLSVEVTEGESNVEINKPLIKQYYAELSGIAEEVGDDSSDLMASILRMPDVLITKEEEVDEEEWAFVRQLMEGALEKINSFRAKEGESLTEDFNQCIGTIEDLLNEVPEFEDLRIDIIKERMRKGLEKLENGADENRYEQELIYYIEKLDISEEKTRLQHHLDYFRDTMKQEGANGKKLGFISQEIGREINTLGSKSYHASLQKIVVQMKDQLEKIKEQVLNTL
tara:strand:+ start:203236 stop:204102 length:867 start_codon:yes stop_codon:yes gene_type:complete